MRKHILPAARLTVLTMCLLAVVYPLLVRGIALLTPDRGKGEVIQLNNKSYYANIGQSFTDDKYFWSRPSAVNYNAAGSGGSNKGPSNAEYLSQVKARIDTFLVHNPGISKSEIPVDLVTASGSGLDPHISVAAAMIQVKRIAGVRQLDEAKLRDLVERHTEKPLWGMLGPGKINVLKLNIALDQQH